MKINMVYLIYSIGALLVLLIVSGIVFKKKPRKLKGDYFLDRWKELQSMLKDKAQWGDAIIRADKLLDEALKKRRFKGKSMGERLVAAQRFLSNNDGVWFGHKLRMQLEQQPELRLKENDVKDALFGLRQALKDIGALQPPQSGETTNGKS